MTEPTEQQKNLNSQVILPEWYEKYIDNFVQSKKDLDLEKAHVEKLNPEDLKSHIGGNFEELPYEALQVLMPKGSDDIIVADVLRDKRTKYLKEHPEMQKDRGASEGVIAFDGRFIPMSDWETATASERRAILVGSTCFHFNSGTPGMDSNPKDKY